MSTHVMRREALEKPRARIWRGERGGFLCEHLRASFSHFGPAKIHHAHVLLLCPPSRCASSPAILALVPVFLVARCVWAWDTMHRPLEWYGRKRKLPGFLAKQPPTNRERNLLLGCTQRKPSNFQPRQFPSTISINGHTRGPMRRVRTLRIAGAWKPMKVPVSFPLVGASRFPSLHTLHARAYGGRSSGPGGSSLSRWAFMPCLPMVAWKWKSVRGHVSGTFHFSSQGPTESLFSSSRTTLSYNA
ncbi:uncharacterized protein C8Q71DRAFT_196897 [Rhodofomes roseus]|uniref:Uncharacterized protein n=1 Tax=Rhodofomes roseus TaxID=34475 RepID=A0ABQ8K809_9APHY|nr:uncharacterized protein C8Q71DRAFT_196897 [Rhodofomes roseus]KAH9833298.1 hypothetical protein C8Q71DRAFT_196897 [Rhodofomes roseus]